MYEGVCILSGISLPQNAMNDDVCQWCVSVVVYGCMLLKEERRTEELSYTHSLIHPLEAIILKSPLEILQEPGGSLD